MAGRAATAVKTTSKAKTASKVAARSKTKAEPGSGTTAEAVKPRTRRKKAETRTRVYWAVFNPSLKRVAVFEFDQKGEAEKRAEKLSASGDHHFIQKIKATVQA